MIRGGRTYAPGVKGRRCRAVTSRLTTRPLFRRGPASYAAGMALFSRLLRLHRGATPVEDFFTEVVADLFEREPDLALDWLCSVGAIPHGHRYRAVRVATQVTYPAILDHATESRPDLVLWLEAGAGLDDVVFVESKVGSSEGWAQLGRYAEHLAALEGVGARTLVYVTRDYDPKDGDAITERAARVHPVSFRQTRWYGFHRLLSARAAAPRASDVRSLHHETLRFMAAHSMDQSNRFTPADALTLGRFRQSISFLDEALRSGPAQRFAEYLGGKNRDAASLTQLRDHNRYVIYRDFDRAHAYFSVVMGYQFGVEGDDYPELRLQLGAIPGGAVGSQVSNAFQGLDGSVSGVAHAAPWSAWDLRPGTNWIGAHLSVPLRALLAADDHLAAVRGTFDGLLDELERVMRAHPALPWTAPAAPEDEGPDTGAEVPV